MNTRLLLFIFLFSAAQLIAAEKIIPVRCEASSEDKESVLSSVFDGRLNQQGWIGAISMEPQWLIVYFSKPETVRAMDIYSGTKNIDAIENFTVQVPDNRGWKDLPGTRIFINQNKNLRISFSTPIVSEKFRILVDAPGSGKQARIREWTFWKSGDDELPLVRVLSPRTFPPVNKPVFDLNSNLIFLNQSGFNTEWPKRFTAPLTPDGTKFSIIRRDDPTKVLFIGLIRQQIGDFSTFCPRDKDVQYIIKIEGGGLKQGISDPFCIAPFWMQRVTLEPMMRFFVDDRSMLGTIFGGFCVQPWRDSPAYAYSLPSLVHLFLSNPSFYLQQQVEMNWKNDFARVFDHPADFLFDHDWAFEVPGSQGSEAAGMYDPVTVAERIRKEIPAPLGEKVPDIIQLIQWGAAWWLTQPAHSDHSNVPLGIHAETISEFASFLYALPWMESYIQKEFSDRVAKYAFEQWEPVGLLKIDKRPGHFKGHIAMGWTILPNLMMHEVAKRMGRGDAAKYLQAAVKQAEWITDSVDFNDPLLTKGLRMSEHKTMNGLVTLLRYYPEYAPKGLTEKVREWADIIISRSDNLWDFRKYDNGANWSLPRIVPGQEGGGPAWNEPGNLAGFASSAWKVASLLGNSKSDLLRKDRLNQIAVAQWDILFGRNPLGAHSSHRGPRDFAGVERGWPVQFATSAGAYLETVRGTLCSSPGTEHFPFNPQGEFRHPEGWSAFNAAFNVSLAESVRHDIKFYYKNGTLKIQGPFFVPEIEVEITDSKGITTRVKLKADDDNQDLFSGSFQSQGKFTVSYGHGFFAARQTFP